MRHSLALLLALSCAAFGQQPQLPQIRLISVATGLVNPVDIQEPDDGSHRLFIVEQRGTIRILINGTLLAQPFLDIRDRVLAGGERGLLGLAFPKDYARKGYFYVNYTDRPGGNTIISRFNVTRDPNIAEPASERALLNITQPFSNHNGGQVQFGPDGYLYIGTGDGGSGGDPQNNGQKTDTLLGKMLRIDVESGVAPYGVPGTNPFVGNSNYRPEIWATGLRNPWRYSFDRKTGDLWTADVGQNRAEEVNFQPASSRGGENYGWRKMEGLQCFEANCDRTGLTLPVLEYPRTEGVSVTGGYVYRGQQFPALDGVYVYGDFGSGRIWGIRREGDQWRNQLLLASNIQVSTFGQDQTGELYVADHQRGVVHRIVAGPPAVSSNGVVNAASFVPGLSPGSIATVFGAGLTGINGVVSAAAYPLPTELAGSSVTLNGTRVPLYAVASVGGLQQINFQVPYELSGQPRANLVVTASGVASTAVETPILEIQPGVFARGTNNESAVLDEAGQVVTSTNGAQRGRTIQIFATGLGAVSNAPATGAAAASSPLAQARTVPTVTIGGASATVTFAGLAPTFAGLYQVNAIVPQGIPEGDADLVISSGAVSSRATRIRIR